MYKTFTVCSAYVVRCVSQTEHRGRLRLHVSAGIQKIQQYTLSR